MFIVLFKNFKKKAKIISKNKNISYNRTQKQHDSILEKDIGQKNADLIRNQISELQQSNQKNNISKSKEILHFIKEVFVNASGSLIAAGVIQAIQSLV